VTSKESAKSFWDELTRPKTLDEKFQHATEVVHRFQADFAELRAKVPKLEGDLEKYKSEKSRGGKGKTKARGIFAVCKQELARISHQ